MARNYIARRTIADPRERAADKMRRAEAARRRKAIETRAMAAYIGDGGTGMFFAIKWHYERGKKEKAKQSAVLRAGGKVAALFVLSLLGLLLLTFGLGRMLGLDLTFP